MKFLANENFPNPSIYILRKRGYEVVSVYETYRGIDDNKVLSKAIENNLIILTFDSDYGKILFHYKSSPPPAVVYFRFKGGHPEDAAKLLINGLDNQGLKLVGFFTVLEKDGIRQRKL